MPCAIQANCIVLKKSSFRRTTRGPLRTLLKSSAVGAVALLLSGVTTPSQAGVVERVVAIVGDRPILLSDLRQRAVPLLMQIQAAAQTEAQTAAATSSMYETLLNRMIDEELERRAAKKQNVRITQREVDEAVERVARQQGLSGEELLAEAVRTGLSKKGYRDEIRRQLLEAKLINMRLAGRVRISEDDLRSHYQRYVFEERKRLSFQAAWIRVPAPRTSDNKQKQIAAKRAQAIAKRAAAGGDFAALAKRYSSHAQTRDSGGLLPEVTPDKLPPSVSRVVMGLEVGDVSLPVRHGDDLVIVKLVSRQESELPTFAEARGELQQRVYMDKMAKARGRWLESLRRRTHVEVRL